MREPSDQEVFWQGAFGDDYVARNQGMKVVAANTAMFGRVLARTGALRSVLELGANRGLNLSALRRLLPEVSLTAVEINEIAASALRGTLPDADVRHCSILDFDPEGAWDLVFTKGVLIHINPDDLLAVYDLMYRASRRYVLMAEYYSPMPVSVDYRGNEERLFKRDFAGDFLDRFDDVSLVDYGFVYRRDPLFPQDDLSWFLMEKSQA